MISDDELVAIPEWLQVDGGLLDFLVRAGIVGSENEKHGLFQLSNGGSVRHLAVWEEFGQCLKLAELAGPESTGKEIQLAEICLSHQRADLSFWEIMWLAIRHEIENEFVCFVSGSVANRFCMVHSWGVVCLSSHVADSVDQASRWRLVLEYDS